MKYKVHQQVNINTGDTSVQGELIIPGKADGIVIFSHGSGSSRFSKRNRAVATYLNEMNFGTLLFDLLTPEEDMYYPNRFNIELLTKRLISTTTWLQNIQEAKGYQLGYFGASTGAACALKAAGQLPQIKALVSRGGRPDLVLEYLHKVKSSTLLLVGSLDEDVLELNRKAYEQLSCEKKLTVIDGASHLFEESGMIEKVCEEASDWFKKYLKLRRLPFTNPVIRGYVGF